MKLILGAIVYPVQTRRWKNYIRQHTVLRDLARQYPRVVHKVYRPYLNTRFSCADRVDILIGHYDCIFAAGLAALVERAATFAVPVADFAGKSGARYRLELAAINTGHREGELTLKLLHEGRCVYLAAFVLVALDGAPAIALGSLQGLRSSDGSQVVKAVTRDLHGCRPKKLMVAAVRAIGDYFGCAQILLIGNQNLVTVNWRRAGRISSNYDATWEEMGALRRADGNYELPCRSAAPNLEAVASHKRAEARRRNALLASLGESVSGSMDQRRLAAALLASARAVGPLQVLTHAQSSNDPRLDLRIG
ncbi:MAG: VirK/YbjX family protein [Pseudomonadota bacterium]|nr:VirK/YbjX family protein [Pseudomonadota bacterium]